MMDLLYCHLLSFAVELDSLPWSISTLLEMKKEKQNTWVSFYINISKFEAFLLVKNFSTNLFFLKSAISSCSCRPIG